MKDSISQQDVSISASGKYVKINHNIYPNKFKLGDTILFDVNEKTALIGQLIGFEELQTIEHINDVPAIIHHDCTVTIKQPGGRIRKRTLYYDLKRGCIRAVNSEEDQKALRNYFYFKKGR